VKFRNWSGLEIECKQLSQFFNAKRAESHCNELKQAMGEFPVCLIDLSQVALICFVQSLCKSASACWIRAGMQPQM
jgi:hypothetical protein